MRKFLLSEDSLSEATESKIMRMSFEENGKGNKAESVARITEA